MKSIKIKGITFYPKVISEMNEAAFIKAHESLNAFATKGKNGAPVKGSAKKNLTKIYKENFAKPE